MYTKAAIGCFLFLTTISYTVADVSHLASGSASFNQQNFNIRDNIPGEPDVDYQIYSVPPISSFSCKGRHYGYYADVESRCQVFRVCATTDLSGKGFAFLCPNGTLFNQKFFVCDWYKNVDCSASESFFSRNALFGSNMGFMSEDDMMSMVQGMVDYTKQPQFNNQNINNNGGFPFSNSQVPKQLENSQSLVNQNNGLASNGNGNSNNHGGSSANQGRANNNAQTPQRGSDILSQPIFPSENNRVSPSTHTQGTSGNAIPSTGTASQQLNQNGNFNFNGRTGSDDNNNQQPTLFVSSLGEISSDPSLRLNPFTTAIVSTRTFDTLSSNVDPVSQKFTSHGQFNQLRDNTQPKAQSANGGSRFNANQYQPNNGLNNQISLEQEINHLSVSQSHQPSSNQNQQSQTQGTNAGTNEQSHQTLTAVYSGSGDLLSHTIGQYGKASSAPQEFSQSGRDPNLSALVNSLGETIYTPIFSGEGNLLSQTISERRPSNENSGKTQQQPNISTTASKLVVSTPQPSLQTPYYDGETKVTSAPSLSTHSSDSNVQDNASKINVVYSGEGNLLSQTIGQKPSVGQLGNSQASNSVNNGKGQGFGRNTQKPATTTSAASFNQGKSHDSSINQGTSIAASSTITQTTQQLPSVNGQSFGQRLGQSNSQSNGNQFSTVAQTTFNNGISFGQKLTTKSSGTSTTAVPYSPSIPPFRSTTTSIYTPTATSYTQHTQTFNGQSRQSHSYTTQHDNSQATFANNQFQVPSKDYLPSADNTRTARTNEVTFGSHAPTPLKLSSSQHFARNGGNQQDARQQFTYPVNQRNQPRPIRDHDTASSNQQNYASPYSASQSQQSNQQAYSTYNQHNTYPQYQQPQQQQPIHYATIENRPNPSYNSFQAPPLQSNYPTAIQNNPQSSSYHSITNRYIPSAPSIPSQIPAHVPLSIPPQIPSSIPPSLPSIVHPSVHYSTQSDHSFSSNQSPKRTSNEKVVVKIIPATGWYLNDANERQSFLDAVSRGLLSDKGFVYVNDVQGSQRQSNLNTQQQQPQVMGRSQIDIDEEAYFHGSSSYESPLNSVGHLPGDSDSVSGLFNIDGSPTSSSTTGSNSSGYQYEHPRRSFNV